VAAGSGGDSRCGGTGDGGGGAGETNGRRWMAAAELSARRRRRQLLRSRAPVAYIGADPLAPVRGWNRC